MTEEIRKRLVVARDRLKKYEDLERKVKAFDVRGKKKSF